MGLTVVTRERSRQGEHEELPELIPQFRRRIAYYCWGSPLTPQTNSIDKNSSKAKNHPRDHLPSNYVGYQHDWLLTKQLGPTGVSCGKTAVGDEHQLSKSHLLPKQPAPTGVPWGAFWQRRSSVMVRDSQLQTRLKQSG